MLRNVTSVWLASLFTISLIAAEHRGVVTFGGLPLPGATVTAKQGGQQFSTITDPEGAYSLDLADGTWSVAVEMQLFEKQQRQVPVANGEAPLQWELTLLPAEERSRLTLTVAPLLAPDASPSTPAPAGLTPTNTKTPFQRTELNPAVAKQDKPAPQAPAGDTPESQDAAELRQRAADGFLINGTVNNAASSPFAQFPAFGNNRRGPRSLYNGNIGVIFNNAAFDARNYSLTGQDTPKPAYSRVQGLLSFGGPFKIPHLLDRYGPTFTINYQWIRNSNASTQSGLMPTAVERAGNLAGSSKIALDPTTGLAFPGNVIPASRVSAQANALLKLYPLPNVAGNLPYNYQIPIVSGQHQDNLQARANKTVKRSNQISGNFGFQSTRTDGPNLFGFLDTGRNTGINAMASWRHSFHPRMFVNIGVQYSRFVARTTPYFANRNNVSGDAGITGNNQDPVNWGPPALSFASGITALSDQQWSLTRNQTTGVTLDLFWNRGRHNITAGTEFRRQQFNILSQQDPRGTLTFTGSATGSDFAGFLLGIPDTSSIAFGNADKYLRATEAVAYINDDWRVNPGLTLNYGLRYEYWGPISERYGRLVNLDLGPGFTTATPVIGNSLIRPDKNQFAPRFGFSWRPLAASSMVVRGGYGIYYDTSVFLPVATQMAQQAPLSTSLRVLNTPQMPLTLANPFQSSGSITPTTFAVDPDFRIGYSQNWQLSVQRDLPWALQMSVTYLGSKGTRGQQQVLPNTYPTGALSPCPSCPSGFSYLTTNGNATREAGQIQLRRRLRSGFTAQAMYTYSKSIDNSSLGGRGQGTALIAQNWLDLRAERARSNFDQRHLLNFEAQYTTGMGLRGGTLINGWKGALFKQWTIATQINAGSGLPLTPVYFAPVHGTGVTGSIRANYTGAPVYAAPAGLHLNPAAYAAPDSGSWGNAGRNSINGPSPFVLNASLGRTFEATDRISLDLRIDATNALNYVSYPNWNTTVTSAQFGLPVSANPMRSIQTTFRVRF